MIVILLMMETEDYFQEDEEFSSNPFINEVRTRERKLATISLIIVLGRIIL